jgi:hypothetical protein
MEGTNRTPYVGGSAAVWRQGMAGSNSLKQGDARSSKGRANWRLCTETPASRPPARLLNGAVEPTDARKIAYAQHGDGRNAAGELMVQHLERVAASVPSEARTVAYLHDMLEHTDASVADLEAEGVMPVELQAVQLLTRDPDESFEAHTLRIAYAQGPEGRLARAVKLADIDDHLSRKGSIPSHRPYGWARRHVAGCRARFDSPPPPPLTSAA